MATSISMTPDKNGQIKLNCDGQEITITVAPGPSVRPSAADDDPFSKWDRNIQYLSTIPDGTVSIRTLDSAADLAATIAALSPPHQKLPSDLPTTHLIRVKHGGSVNFHSMQGISVESPHNLHVLFVPDDV